ncbi:hypothetical protein C2845_PM01G47340 [Panicum miliaceum]|uniref:Uncharacterized protein n=1 Tax=Panicum miliaceum TaxID=4540 RepID=A0A3L6TFZ2_PANMI|nr:hypothetical protein C2845_PM01G47340 [Panicum miliaceum]
MATYTSAPAPLPRLPPMRHRPRFESKIVSLFSFFLPIRAPPQPHAPPVGSPTPLPRAERRCPTPLPCRPLLPRALSTLAAAATRTRRGSPSRTALQLPRRPWMPAAASLAAPLAGCRCPMRRPRLPSPAASPARHGPSREGESTNGAPDRIKEREGEGESTGGPRRGWGGRQIVPGWHCPEERQRWRRGAVGAAADADVARISSRGVAPYSSAATWRSHPDVGRSSAIQRQCSPISMEQGGATKCGDRRGPLHRSPTASP